LEDFDFVSVKLLMSWDILPGQEKTYFDFVMQTFAPGMVKLGLQPTEAWYTLFGDAPQILTGGVTDSVDKMREILDSVEWDELKSDLLEYVTNFQFKVVPATGRFQL
jgi:hypothetical protein